MSEGWSRKRLLVYLEPEGATRTFQYRVAYGLIAAVLTFLVVLVIVFIVGGTIFARGIDSARKADQLSAANDSLRVEFRKLRAIEAQLGELRRVNERMLRLAGVDSDRLLDDLASGLELNQTEDSVWRYSQPHLPPRVGIQSRGFRSEPKGSEHLGVDIPGPIGVPIFASGGGIVTRVGEDAVYGKVVTLDHGSGITSLYGHNDAILVSQGDSVLAGQPIARLGNTGKSSAPHLHFEIRLDDVPVDPADFIFEYSRTP